MYQFKHLLVGISLNDQDGASIRYASLISRLARSEKITFVHVAANYEIDEEICEMYPELRASCEAPNKRELVDLVEKHYDGYPDTHLDYEIVEGAPLIELLRSSKELEIDLIVMRKREGDKTRGNLVTKLVRKAPCSVLLVPEKTNAWYKHIVVPVDFSKNSEDALQVAISLAIASEISEIGCLHVYSVPNGYYKTGKSYEQFAEIMKGHAERKYKEFIEKIDLRGISVAPKFRLNEKEYRGIWEEILEERETNLLVMGARGRKAGAGVLLGSVTERLVHTTTAPLLAVKEKGSNLGILDAILKL